MTLNAMYSGYTVEEQRQLQAIDGQLESVRRVDPKLADLLPAWDSLSSVLRHLESATTPELLVRESREEQRLWHDAGLFYQFSGRFHDAIALYKRLYEKICDHQQQDLRVWLPKGTPLVRLAECHERLGHALMSARYLLLTAVSDAIRDRGKIDSNGGVYYRALSHGWTSEDLNEFYENCSSAFDTTDTLCAFPEQILSKVAVPFSMPYAAPAELDIYEINKAYSGKILDVMKAPSTKVTGKDLEKLAWYFLGSIPGFEVRSDLRAEDTQYDGLVRNTGPKYDFRADLGFHLLVECKQWSEAVGVAEVSQFINKLVLQDCGAGFLFSSRGITGEGKMRDAELQILKAHYRAGKVILVLNESDFRSVSAGKNLLLILREKYEELRFDINR
jgi:hypothetical protein